MKQVNLDPRVMVVVEIEKMNEKLKKAYSLLEIIQKGLNAVCASSNSSFVICITFIFL